MVIVSRNRLINDGYLKEDIWVKIWYGHHAKMRMDERSKGSLGIMPHQIKITRKSLVKGYIHDGKLERFVIRTPYIKGQLLYLVLTPSYFMKDEYFIKSLWFRDILPKDIIKTTGNVISNNYYAGSDHSAHHAFRTEAGLGPRERSTLSLV